MKKQLSLRRSVLRRLVVGLGVCFLLVTIVASPFGLYRQRDTYQCSTCLSKRDDFQWRIGSWGGYSLPLSRLREQPVESTTFKQFTPRPHVHDWRFAQGSPYYWFGTQWRGCAIGSGRHRNDLGDMMEMSLQGFDEYISRTLATGATTTNQLYEALISQRWWRGETNPPTPAQARAQQLVDGFWREP